MEFTVALIPILAYLTNEALKKAGMNSKYSGLVNILVGGIGGFVLIPSALGVVVGVLAGLSAGGVYSSVKKLKK